MGFDIYGLNPQHNKKEPLQLTKLKSEFGQDGWMQYDKMTEKQRNLYFKLDDKVKKDNPGGYFRNNVWWWRPLWDFVCNTCGDFLSESDMEGGSFNDGRKIAKYKAIKIGKRLSENLADGTVHMVYRRYELAKAKADVHNKKVRKEMDKISKNCKAKHGDDLVPADYPEPYHTQWKKAQNKEDWTSHYPFNVDNVKEFAAFCQQSGGFEIC